MTCHRFLSAASVFLFAGLRLGKKSRQEVCLPCFNRSDKLNFYRRIPQKGPSRLQTRMAKGRRSVTDGDKRLWAILWQSFCSAWGFVGSLIAVFGALLTWQLAPNVNVNLIWVVVLSEFFLIAAATLLFALLKTHAMISPGFPKVHEVMEPHAPFSACKAICLLGSCDTFSTGASVSFFDRKRKGYEQFVGIGKVVQIQDDKQIVVTLQTTFENTGEWVENLLKNNVDALANLIVKPFIPEDQVAQLLTQRTKAETIVETEFSQNPSTPAVPE